MIQYLATPGYWDMVGRDILIRNDDIEFLRAANREDFFINRVNLVRLRFLTHDQERL